MANSYLSFTQAAGTSRRKFTYSVWMKRSSIDTSGSYNSGFFNCWSDANNRLAAYFYDNKLYLYGLSGGSANISVRTNRLFRDTSAWYHIVIAVDTTQGTAADRIKFYVNGVQETSLDQTTYPAQDHDLPSVGVNAKAIEVGRVNFGDQSTYYYMDGYLSHVAFVDGTALTPTSFGETDSTSGIWKFKSPSGVTWGTNGFHLKFENSGALGTDSSGNTNTFTVNGNLKQALDTPSNVYCTLNPLEYSPNPASLENGNTTYNKQSTGSGHNATTTATLGVMEGKWYYEFKPTNTTAFVTGIVRTNHVLPDAEGYFGNDAGGYGVTRTGRMVAGSESSVTGLSIGANDIVGLAFDLDNGKFYVHVNGTYMLSGDPTSGSTGTGSLGNIALGSNIYVPYVANANYDGTNLQYFNFGNGFFGTTAITSAGSNGNGSLFEYDVPSGYYALNTKNINTYG